jgi:hypothetical protein
MTWPFSQLRCVLCLSAAAAKIVSLEFSCPRTVLAKVEVGDRDRPFPVK